MDSAQFFFCLWRDDQWVRTGHRSVTGRIPIAIDQPCPLHCYSNMENVWACELKYQRHQSWRDLQGTFPDLPPRNDTNTEEGILHPVVCSAVYGLPLGEWNLHSFSAVKVNKTKASKTVCVFLHGVPSLWKCPCLFVPKWAFEKKNTVCTWGVCHPRERVAHALSTYHTLLVTDLSAFLECCLRGGFCAKLSSMFEHRNPEIMFL